MKNIMKELCLSYATESETVPNCIAASDNLVEPATLELLKK